MKWILLSAIILASGCAAPKAPVTVSLPIPPALSLPEIAADEMMCLSEQAYSDLVIRDMLQAERITTLENIIRSTH